MSDNADAIVGRTTRIAYLLATAVIVALLISAALEAVEGGPIIPKTAKDDFGRFQAAAQLVVEGRAAKVYDPDILGARVAENVAVADWEPLAFGHPPFFLLYFVPLAYLSFPLGYVIFVVAGLAALVAALKMLGLSHPWQATGLALLTAPALASLQLGQLGFWAATMLVVIFVLLRSGNAFAAGLLLPLLAFKPPYVLGIGLWWLLQPRRYGKALLGSALSSTILVALGFLVPDGWSTYLGFMRGDASLFVTNVALSGRSLLEMWVSLLYPDTSLAGFLWILSAGIVTYGLVTTYRQIEHNLAVSFAAAVVAGLVLSPRTGWYDWVLLIVPAAILWRHHPDHHPRIASAGAALFLMALLSRPLVQLTDALFGVHIQLAPLVLLGVTWWLIRGMFGHESLVPAIESHTRVA
jgi:hypothetical protein